MDFDSTWNPETFELQNEDCIPFNKDFLLSSFLKSDMKGKDNLLKSSENKIITVILKGEKKKDDLLKENDMDSCYNYKGREVFNNHGFEEKQIGFEKNEIENTKGLNNHDPDFSEKKENKVEKTGEPFEKPFFEKSEVEKIGKIENSIRIPFSSLKKIDFQSSELFEIENQFDSLKKKGAFEEQTTEVLKEKENNLKFLFKSAMLQKSPPGESSNQTDQKDMSSNFSENNPEDIQVNTNEASASGSGPGGNDEDNRKNKSLIEDLVEEFGVTIEQFIMALGDGQVPFFNIRDLKILSYYHCQIRDCGVYIEIVVPNSKRVYYRKEGLYTFRRITREEAQNFNSIQQFIQKPPVSKNQDFVFINNNNFAPFAPEEDTQSVPLQQKNIGVQVFKKLKEDKNLPFNNYIYPLLGLAVLFAILRKKSNIFLFKKKEKKEKKEE